jgi:DnaJ-class molecular chaperone
MTTNQKPEAFTEETCPKCQGRGRIAESLRDYQTCYACSGHGTILIDLEAIRQFQGQK